jgi:hypothetical protein
MKKTLLFLAVIGVCAPHADSLLKTQNQKILLQACCTPYSPGSLRCVTMTGAYPLFNTPSPLPATPAQALQIHIPLYTLIISSLQS